MMGSAKQADNDMMKGLGAAPRIDIPENRKGRLGRVGMSNDLMGEPGQLRVDVENLFGQVEDLQDKQEAAMARVEIMSAQIRSVAQLLSMFVEGLQQQAQQSYDDDEPYELDSQTSIAGHQVMGADQDKTHMSLDAFELGEHPEVLSENPAAMLFSQSATVKGNTLKEAVAQAPVDVTPKSPEVTPDNVDVKPMVAPAV